MSVLTLYNTISRQKQVFYPQNPKRVTMYVCGPTVYNYAHIGNARPAIVFDVLRRLLEHEYGEGHVIYARNITDIEDKIIKTHMETGISIEEITTKYGKIYNEDMASLNVLPPHIEPWATHHMDGMIKMMQDLEAKGHAYETPSGLLFDVNSMPDYGKLSGRKLDDLLTGAREAIGEDITDEKRHPADFALWKKAKPGEPTWESPWGKGRPGWHIECSVMAKAHLGETIDIHGGGIDLQFPHHENEIAQSECAHGGKVFANYWLHNGFLDMAGEKMSKSLGNVELVHELLKTWPGEVLRFAMLTGHYRAPLDWTDELLKQSKTTLDRLYGALGRVWDAGETDGEAEAPAAILDAVYDDIGTPKALAALGALAGEANKASDAADKARIKAEMLAAGELLGLFTHTPENWAKGVMISEGKGLSDSEIDALVGERDAARAAKDWAKSDDIRDQLKAEGIEIMDSADGASWRRV